MYVCVCKAVTEKQIHEAIQAGALTLKDLRRTLGVTEECAQCATRARECLKEARHGSHCPHSENSAALRRQGDAEEISE